MSMNLILGDCLEKMKDIPDGSVDMVLTDPPYGTTKCKWDTVIPFEPMWKELNRVTKKNGATVLFGIQPFTSALVMSNPKMFKYEWIWEKSHPTGFGSVKYNPLKYHENLLVFGRGTTTYNPQKWIGSPNHSMGKIVEGGQIKSDSYIRIKAVQSQQSNEKYPKSVQKFSNPRYKNMHPTQKPVALLEYLIKTYTNEGETVLDFTTGSGSTGVACQNTGRNFIGIEKDENYFEIAKNRILNLN